MGLGNRLMMDDGIGVAVVELLAKAADGVRYEVAETDFAYALEVAAEADSVLIVDAALTGGEPGTVTLLPLADMAISRPGLSLHQLHFVDLLLQLALPQEGALIGITPAQVEFHLGLSDLLQAQLDPIVRRVRSIIDAWRTAPG
ncbi:MAG TPA: hydrogenase maturation protease [Symbiobacteriaceae bacterium]|nr:hydrogenase maturation protease [Symbiobacteriaceae bacterium]